MKFMTPKKESKEKFMLEQYRTAWNNIDNHREGLWKLLVPYLGLAFLNYSTNNLLSLEIMLVIIFLINTFIIGISINFNLWFIRNIRLSRNIETYFLSKDDYGKLLPKKYAQDGCPLQFMIKEIWMFVIYFIGIIHIGLWIFYVFFSHAELINKMIISLVFLTSLHILVLWYFYHKKRYYDFVNDTKGYLSNERI